MNTVAMDLAIIYVVSFCEIGNIDLDGGKIIKKKSRRRETPTLSTDADRRTDTILERLRDLPILTKKRTWSM